MIVGYKIQLQRRTDYNGKYPRSDYRAWREFCVWPLLFRTSAMAWAYWNSINDPFKNFRGRKVSMTVIPVKGNREDPLPRARFYDLSDDPRNEHRVLNAVRPGWDYGKSLR